MLGPSHHVYIRSCCTTGCEAYETPHGIFLFLFISQFSIECRYYVVRFRTERGTKPGAALPIAPYFHCNARPSNPIVPHRRSATSGCRHHVNGRTNEKQIEKVPSGLYKMITRGLIYCGSIKLRMMYHLSLRVGSSFHTATSGNLPERDCSWWQLGAGRDGPFRLSTRNPNTNLSNRSHLVACPITM